MLAEPAILRRTPLYGNQKKIGARLTPFHGWELPLYFSSIIKEHEAVRASCGLFDVSHMGRLWVSGPGALELLQKTNPNDVASLEIGRALYSHFLNEKGGILDDFIVARMGEERYLLVVNAARLGQDKGYLARNNSRGARITDDSEKTAMLAVQGPRAAEVLSTIGLRGAANLSRFGALEESLRGEKIVASRTGYTGEDGFELIVPSAAAPDLWEKLLSSSGGKIIPCGLGCRDTLRLEAGYILYGQDATEDHTSLEAGCGWIVKWDKGDFIGRDALLKQKREGLKRGLRAVKLSGAGVPRPGDEIFTENGAEKLGVFSSATFSPSLKTGIGLSYLPGAVRPGTKLSVLIHGRPVPADAVETPFYKGSAHAQA